jgi:hypothetical protein
LFRYHQQLFAKILSGGLMFRIALAAAVLTISASASFAGCVDLGERRVGFIQDHDRIEVGRIEGRFTKLRLRVHGNDIELRRIIVEFGNGQREDAEFHRQIPQGGEADFRLTTRWSDGRFIRAVNLNYRSRPDFRGEARVVLLGCDD